MYKFLNYTGKTIHLWRGPVIHDAPECMLIPHFPIPMIDYHRRLHINVVDGDGILWPIHDYRVSQIKHMPQIEKDIFVVVTKEIAQAASFLQLPRADLVYPGLVQHQSDTAIFCGALERNVTTRL